MALPRLRTLLLLGLALSLAGPCKVSLAAEVSVETRQDLAITVVSCSAKVTQNAQVLELTAGETLELQLGVEGAGPGSVRTWANKLPDGAAFDAESMNLSWVSSPDGPGTYRLEFSVSDGEATVTRAFYAHVLPNFPPRLQLGFIGNSEFDVLVGAQLAGVLVSDSSGELRLENVILPDGASLNVREHKEIFFRWRPTTRHIGSHRIVFTATDGVFSLTPELIVHVHPTSPRDNPSYWGLSGGPSAITGFGSSGILYGAELGVVPVSWGSHALQSGKCRRRGSDCQPFIERLLLQFRFLKGNDDIRALTYGLTYERSIETNPARTWLLPMLGFEAGGIYHSKLGHGARISPSLGLRVLQSALFMVEITAGPQLVATASESATGAGASLRLLVHADRP